MLLLNIQTIQTSVIKNLIEALKDIIIEINLVATKTGIKAIAVNNTKTVLAELKLRADKFEKYECTEKLVIGLDMIHLYKIIKTMSNSDILSLYVNEEQRNVLGIMINNPDVNTMTNYKLKLLDLPENKFSIPLVEHDLVVSLHSSQFQKIIKEMNGIAKTVEIRAIGDEFIFSCSGLFTERETIIKENENGMTFEKKLKEGKIVQCIYLLKILTTFTKCTGLSHNIKLSLKNDYALELCYDVGSLGTLKLILSNYSEHEK